MLGRAAGEKKFRKAVEEQRLTPRRLTGSHQICEVDVGSQVASAGLIEQIPADALLVVGSGSPEPAQPRIEELLLRISIVERDEEASPDKAADVCVIRFPLEREIHELPVR